MMRSLYSGVAGLKVHQTKMDVIGNNIANVNTVGYKSQSVTFTDVFYQTVQSASGPNAETGTAGTNAKQIGIGATLGAISTNISAQGGTQTTDNPFDLMINGDEFFVVSDGQENYFTKAGNFTVDGAGNLVTGTGYNVMGWPADETGRITQGRVQALQVMSTENMLAQPERTTSATVAGNINQEDDSFSSEVAAIDQYVAYNVQFYDSQGYLYTATYNVTKNTNTDQTTDYTFNLYSIAKEDGTIISQAEKVTDATTGVESYNYLNAGKAPVARFNNTTDSLDGTVGNAADGARVKIKPGTLISITENGGNIGTYTGNFRLDLNLSEVIANGVNEDGEQLDDTDVPLSLRDQVISIDYSGVTNYGSKSTIAGARGIDGLGAGKTTGNLSTLSIASDGKITGSYTNGDKITLGQIAVTSFANAAGLEKIGDNLFSATLNSGSFDGIGQDISANGDSFTTGVLEMSNVDLSTEFTSMITTQRGFQANSRIITTSDTMLEELINLKR